MKVVPKNHKLAEYLLGNKECIESQCQRFQDPASSNPMIPGSGKHTWTGFQRLNVSSIMQGVGRAQLHVAAQFKKCLMLSFFLRV